MSEASWTRVTRSAAATKRIAATLARALRAPQTVTLQGELGAGKTTFAQGFIAALGVDEREVKSPTYALAVSHRTPGASVHHIDLYRVDDEASLVALGLDDLIADEEAIALVEWPERAPDLLANAVRVFISHRGARSRTIVIEGTREILAAIDAEAPAARPARATAASTKRARVDR